jgi:HTH-type transcriptional regulator/antitoxin HigA
MVYHASNAKHRDATMQALRPIRTFRQYETALAEMERLWGAKSGTPEGDRLDALATLIDAYEAKQFPMDAPDPASLKRFRRDQQGY